MNKLIIAPRGSGKTSALIKASAECDCPIIVPTISEATNVMDKALEMGYYDIPEPIPFGMRNKFHGEDYQAVIIDNLDVMLPTILEDYFGAKVEAAVASYENVKVIMPKIDW